MILYGFSIQGKSHIEKDTICQDSNKTARLQSGYYFGAVADGVGSAPHSDIGSKLAVEELCEYCNENIKRGMGNDEIEDVLYDGYEYALNKIKEYAVSKSGRIEDYDTTLSSVIYDGKKVIYGHSGDGGIIIRQTDGIIRPITKRQKGSDGMSVIPLRAGGNSWEIATYSGNVAGVLLVTDGMLDGVLQPSLLNLPSSKQELANFDFPKDNIYITAAEFFMNPYAVFENPRVKDAQKYLHTFLQGNLTGEDQDSFLQCMRTAYEKLLGKKQSDRICETLKKLYYAVWAVKNVKDDKSVVCLMNEKTRVTPQDEQYYLEPDWKWRQECQEALLYNKEMPPKPADEPVIKNLPEPSELPELKDDKGKKLDDGKKFKKIALIARVGLLTAVLVIGLICVFRVVGSDNTDTTLVEKPTATSIPTPTATAEEIDIEELAEDILRVLSEEDLLQDVSSRKKRMLYEELDNYLSFRDLMNRETNDMDNQNGVSGQTQTPEETARSKSVDKIADLMKQLGSVKEAKEADEFDKSILYEAARMQENKHSMYEKMLQNLRQLSFRNSRD